MSEHNETPWYANGPAVYMGADGGFSLRCCPNPEANARHIVHCVNNHERLVEALRNTLRVIDGEDGTYSINRDRKLLAQLQAGKGGE